MALFIISTLLGGVNYITTVINLRTQGMSMTKLPLTIWAFFLTAILGLLSFPVLFSGALLLIFDRSFGTSFFLSDIYVAGQALERSGGSPILFQHLFWFLGHPEVYIVILPGMGIVNEVISVQLPQAYLRLPGHDRVYDRYCAAFVYRVGAPHVHFRHESVPGLGVHVPDAYYCGAFCGESV